MNLEPKIIFQNSEYVVVDKPVGLTVNKSDTTKGQYTLQDWVNQQINRSTDQENKEGETDFYKRAGIVHRLDKDTSGVIIIAKTPQAFENLQLQFKNREVQKTYLAVVWGSLKDEGEVNAPITRNPYNRFRFGVFVGGKEARTGYKAVKEIKSGLMTLVEVYPHTGRTHQIRVHLTYIGHPIVGDPLYSGGKKGKSGQEMFGRLLLHAYKITFADPGSGKKVEYKANIPEEFKRSTDQ